MTTIGGTRALYSAQRAFKADLNALLDGEAQALRNILLRYSLPDTPLDPRLLPRLKQEVGARIEALFVPAGTQAGLSDEGRPLAPYGRLLLRAMTGAVVGVVQGHQTYLRRVLPDPLQRWLQTGTQAVGEARLQESYTPPHLLIRDSMTLSDRIWRAGVATRLKIDGLLSDAVRTGVPPLRLAALLEQFLLPTRAALRTRKPYGTDASYDAMRLARSVIAEAHGLAAKEAAIANPFVTGVDWGLSARHPRADICDRLATLGMSGDRLRDPYPPADSPVPIDASHPQCLCFLAPFVTPTPATTTAQLTAAWQQGRPAPLTPLNGAGFLTYLLGAALAADGLQALDPMR